MKLSLDPTHCDGYGICAQLLPEVISLDEWGFPVLGKEAVVTGFESDRRSSEIPLEFEHLAHRVVISCPRLALRLDQ